MKTAPLACVVAAALMALLLAGGTQRTANADAPGVSDQAVALHSINAIPNGLHLRFTRPVDPAWLADPLNYTVTLRRDQPTAEPDGPKTDQTPLTHLRPIPAEDGASVDLYIDGLKTGHTVHVRFAPRNTDGRPMPPAEASYTLNHIPPMDRDAQYYGDPPDDTHPWSQHDTLRPLPPMAEPMPDGPVTTPPPDGAVVLFDGTDLSAWQKENGQPVTWVIDDDAMRPTPGSGDIVTKETFGDVRLHLEWLCPESETKDQGQQRGNSGVFLMGLYEIQILETKDNITYADGMAAAIYGQTPPTVNAGLGPGQWQSYDITFHRPRFNDHGEVTEPARATVYHNGVLVQHNTPLEGPTQFKQRTRYQPHEDQLPIKLQDHGDPVRFRNIWAEPLE